MSVGPPAVEWGRARRECLILVPDSEDEKVAALGITIAVPPRVSNHEESEMRLGFTACVAGAVLATACLAHDVTPPINPGGGGGGGIPQFQHVVLVVEENKNYASVLGDSTVAPYFHMLSESNGLATQYYANTHPSIGNYFMMTTGQILTNDDSWRGTVTDDNIARELVAAGKTWKAYAEDLPSVGYLGYGE